MKSLILTVDVPLRKKFHWMRPWAKYHHLMMVDGVGSLSSPLSCAMLSLMASSFHLAFYCLRFRKRSRNRKAQLPGLAHFKLDAISRLVSYNILAKVVYTVHARRKYTWELNMSKIFLLFFSHVYATQTLKLSYDVLCLRNFFLHTLCCLSAIRTSSIIVCDLTIA